MVRIFLFSTCNVNPSCASQATSSSNKSHTLSNVVQMKSVSSANRKSNKGLGSLSKRQAFQLPFSHAMKTKPFVAPNQINVGQVHILDAHHREYFIHSSRCHLLCPKFMRCSIQIKCSEVLCCPAAVHNAFHSILSSCGSSAWICPKPSIQ